jgi:ABC-type glutathione transport system ATPase component
MAGIIELKNVSFSAQTRLIVEDFSYQFEEGKTTALVGPSGCGKSTILKLAAGLLVPSEGEICFRDVDIFSMNRHENLDFRREAAMVFQDSALWENQSLFQILELPLRIHFPAMPLPERKARISAVLLEVGYTRDTGVRPSQLSMGERKLIAFARALTCGPKLLFLDEWTESLNDSAAKRLIELVKRHQKEQNTVICVSHNFGIVKSISDYVLMIVDGKLLQKLTREQIENDDDLVSRVERGIAS